MAALWAETVLRRQARTRRQAGTGIELTTKSVSAPIVSSMITYTATLYSAFRSPLPVVSCTRSIRVRRPGRE